MKVLSLFGLEIDKNLYLHQLQPVSWCNSTDIWWWIFQSVHIYLWLLFHVSTRILPQDSLRWVAICSIHLISYPYPKTIEWWCNSSHPSKFSYQMNSVWLSFDLDWVEQSLFVAVWPSVAEFHPLHSLLGRWWWWRYVRWRPTNLVRTLFVPRFYVKQLIINDPCIIDFDQ